jgi:hypothetical protein
MSLIRSRPLSNADLTQQTSHICEAPETGPIVAKRVQRKNRGRATIIMSNLLAMSRA